VEGLCRAPGRRGLTGWTDNYAEALESAKLDNKKLLLDFTGSDWCGYCMALEKEVLSTAEVPGVGARECGAGPIGFPQEPSTEHPGEGAEYRS
jgi:thiol-disulfide isomerase/thioredoxin